MCMLYLDVRMRQNQRLMNMQQVGNSSPLHSTGIGKLLLLNYSEEQLDQMIARKGLTRYTEHTITTKAALLAELDKVRRQGYALDNEENEVGSRCMACPIRDYSGDIVAGGFCRSGMQNIVVENTVPSCYHYNAGAAA